MSDKKLAECVIKFGKWAGLKLSEIPIDALWWLIQGDYVWETTRKAVRQYFSFLWKHPEEGWLTFGKHMGVSFGECPTWWLQSQLDWMEIREARHGCWPAPKEMGNWSPVVKHLLRKELLQRETELGVLERRDDGSWYEKLPLDERENNFSVLGELKDAYPDLPSVEWHECNAALPHWVKPPSVATTGVWVRTMHFTTWGDQGWYEEWELQMKSTLTTEGRPSLWYLRHEERKLPDPEVRPAAERKDYAVVMSRPSYYTKRALQKALSYKGCGCTKRCDSSCECGCHAAWNRWRKLDERKEVLATWLDTLRMLEVSCNKEETLLTQYLEACRWIANIVEGDDYKIHQMMQILHTNYVRELQREEAREMLACDTWHEAREEEDDADDDEASPKKLSERRQQERRKEEVCDEARDFIEDLRRQKRARKKLLKYKSRYEPRTDYAEETLEEARNQPGGAWACKVCIGDTEGVRLCE